MTHRVLRALFIDILDFPTSFEVRKQGKGAIRLRPTAHNHFRADLRDHLSSGASELLDLAMDPDAGPCASPLCERNTAGYGRVSTRALTHGCLSIALIKSVTVRPVVWNWPTFHVVLRS